VQEVTGVVIGNYQIVRKLGEGGMGTVYLGQHTLLGRRAAIKVLLPELSARQDIVNRFFNEARAVTTISDPGIVQVFDFGYHTDGSAFIVMELLEGEPLDRRLARLHKLPVAEALRLCRQLASSLAAAHAQHIIHRDLKPENIYLVRDGEVASGERSKILDFGIAKLSDDHPGKVKTHTGALMGTPIYMSPEQCRGLAELDHRSDIYALGCVLFHLITGRPPFEGEGMGDILASHIREAAPAPSSIAPEISPSVDALVLRCLAKAPAERYQTMVELAAAIGQILPYVTSPESPTQYFYVGPVGGTPVPPPPSVPPGPYPSQHPSLAVARPGTRPPSPTTLGGSAGQLAAPITVPPPRRRGWLYAVVAIFVVVGAGVGVVASRGERSAAIPDHDARPAAAPKPDFGAVARAAPDAAPIAAPAPAVPAPAPAATPATPPPAPAPVAPAPPEATPAVVAAPVATPSVAAAPPARKPARRPPASHKPSPASTTTPSTCDRSVDADCDGIPDVR
jgi:serine/threonine-protein kinase